MWCVCVLFYGHVLVRFACDALCDGVWFVLVRSVCLWVFLLMCLFVVSADFWLMLYDLLLCVIYGVVLSALFRLCVFHCCVFVCCL